MTIHRPPLEKNFESGSLVPAGLKYPAGRDGSRGSLRYKYRNFNIVTKQNTRSISDELSKYIAFEFHDIQLKYCIILLLFRKDRYCYMTSYFLSLILHLRYVVFFR